MMEDKLFNKRQKEIVELLLEGKSNKQIALALGISQRTVEYHLRNIYDKLHVNSAKEAILRLGKSTVVETNEGLGKSTIAIENKSADNVTMSIFRRIPMKSLLTITVLGLLGIFLFSRQYQGIAIPTAPFSDAQLKTNPGLTPGISLLKPLTHHTLTRLLDGRILVVGGSQTSNEQLAETEIFNPNDNSIISAGPMHTPRHDHSATLLRDGRVLVIGGYNNQQQWLSDAEIYDPARNLWTAIAPLYPHGTIHTATLLKDGRVLVVGGCIGGGVCTERVELFDPRTDTWIPAASLPAPRSGQTADLLNDGRVLVAGGTNANGLSVGGDAFIYDPQKDQWTVTGPMISPRSFAGSVQLKNGHVLVAGGIAADGAPVWNVLSSAEIYDPASNTWSAAASLSTARFQYVLTSFNNGQILAIGGTYDGSQGSFVSKIESYDTGDNQWKDFGELPQPTTLLAAVHFHNDRLWVTGGQSNTGFLQDTWIISPSQP
jgi:DNA-binding CsgD family transcriptional regulator/N-acetylneuraminic acid mutarotase